MNTPVISRVRSNSHSLPFLRFRVVSGAAVFSLLAFGAHAQTPAVEPPPPLMISPHDSLIGNPGADPMTTSAIDPTSRGVGKSGADILQPSAIHYRLPEGKGPHIPPNELGMPMPDAPVPVVIGAPNVKIMIGARLLGDETVLKSALPIGQREAILKVYEERGYEPFWVKDGAWNKAAQSVLEVLSDARSHGLPPARYLVPSIASGRIQALADADIRLTVAVATYARDARGGLLDRSKLGPLAMPRLDLPSVENVLAEITDKGEKAGEMLSNYQPSAPGYEALRIRLIALQKLSSDRQNPAQGKPMVSLPDNPALKLSQGDERTWLLRGQSGLDPADDPANSRLYDSLLAEAAAAFQEQQGQSASTAGAGPMVVALAGSSMNMLPVRPVDIARLEAALRVNMERWRWLPRDLGERYVLVNVPEQNVKVVDHGEVIQKMLGIVGQPDTPTPILSGNLGTVVLNPDWILSKARIESEIVPNIKRDNTFAVNRGYEIVREGRKITVREPANVRYELGQVKFLLSNDLSFYLHNTPDHSLFEKEKRIFSKGTVRVDEPLKFAETVLGKDWTENRLGKLIGGDERSLRLAKPLPIHVTYFTAAVDSDGKIRTYSDIYSYDQPLKKALNDM